MMRGIVLAGAAWAMGTTGALAQTGAVRGSVTDSATAAPLPLVRVELRSGAFRTITTTDERGLFRIGDVPAGTASLHVTRIGYRPADLRRMLAAGDTLDFAIRLSAAGIPLDPVIVSASRTAETALEAPAAVSVVERGEIERSSVLAPVEVVRDEPGVDMATKGLIQRTFSVRGDATVNSGALLLLTDYRYAALPSVAFNIPYLIAAGAEDLDRIELVRGPASALYGPGAPRGVLHLISRSPFEGRGGLVALTAGSRSSIGGEFRVAERLGSRFAVKLSGSYLRGDDWEATDPQEQSQRADAIARGADPDTLRIGIRDFGLGRASGEARLDWRPDGRTEVVTTLGAAQALTALDLTPFGAIQGRDWRYSFGQIRLTRDRLTANVFYNWSDAGDSYVLRTGEPLVDDSRVLVGQLQHGTSAGSVDLLYGADVRWTNPRTGGTISGENEDRDNTTEIGGYAHAVWPVTPQVNLTGALRLDHHTALNDLAVSPRLAVVYKPARTHALRASYNRAFSSPDANDLFLDILAARYTLEGSDIGYDLWGTGVPKDGFHFRRDCDGRLCMRSPFAFLIGASSTQYLPADATLLWPAVVTYAQTLGVDLSGIPAPDASQVGTRIARLDINAPNPVFVDLDPADLTDVQGEGRTITNALELGYKGFLGTRLSVTADLWMSRVSDVAGSQEVATPSVLFDRPSLEAYLAQYMTPAQAAQLADTIAQIPAGTVSPEEALHPTALLAVSPRGGAYTLWGADLGLDVAVTPAVTVGGTYSWMNADTIPNVDVLGVVYLNAPRDKASARIEYRSERLGFFAGLRGRYVRSYSVKNGVYEGRVEAYGILDAAVGVAVPWLRVATLTVTVQNLLDERHIEFVGAPEIGRFALARLRVGW
jgi:iron complex outermembrane receptor protein